ncbi:MAG: FAD/NAD(P)-binding protein [Planctomycetota bacterium]|nr:FAD/NAD(P)-binding protein [Planctomycetota bacterium]
MLPRAFRVAARRRETHDVFTLELEPADAPGEAFAFEPGQFNMLYVLGAGEVPISISGDPTRPGRLMHTVRAVGGVTRLLEGLKKGDSLGVRGPYGAPWPVLDAEGRDVVVVAGGIGLAPLRPLICQVLARRDRFGRVSIVFGTRSPADILLAKDLERWRSKFDVDVLLTVDHAPPGWRGHVGVVTALLPRAAFDPANARAFVCGPEVMMRFTVQELAHRGLPAASVHVTMERNMKCAIGLCGHCQYGPEFVCKDGPVFRFDRIERIFGVREL